MEAPSDTIKVKLKKTWKPRHATPYVKKKAVPFYRNDRYEKEPSGDTMVVSCRDNEERVLPSQELRTMMYMRFRLTRNKNRPQCR
jgi:hypothetical protein